ncbi:MAG: porin [Candidatus Scalindua sediminis]|nr:porin [Candidatus Scalindua sediminis]
MERKKVCLFLPLFAAFAIFAGSMLYADVDVVAEGGRAKAAAGIDREALKAEIMEELRAEMLSTARAEIQSAAVPEVSQAAISSAVSSALEESGILSGLFKGTTVGGFIDTMFSYNFRQHGEATSENNGDIGGLNFIGENDDNTFTLNNFALWLDKEATEEHPIGWQAHLYFGEIAKRITFIGERAGVTDSSAGAGGTDDVARNDIVTIPVANVTWNAPVLGRTVPITMGKMYTWIGYELVENIGNPNYSHGAVYNNVIPFTHMGLSFDVSEFLPSDKLGLTLYYVNGWDSFIDNNESKSYGGYLTYEPNDDFFISLAVINGNEGWNTRSGATLVDPTAFDPASRNNGGNTFMYDIVATYALPQVEKLSLGANWDWGRIEDFKGHDANGDGFVDGTSSGQWWAAVGYAMYDFTDAQQGALRYEYFDDTDGARFFGHSIWTITYTHNITINDNLLLRPEVRYNKHNVPESDELSVGDKGSLTADDEVIFTVGAEYVF